MRSFVARLAREQPNEISLLNIPVQEASHRKSFQVQGKAQEYGDKLCWDLLLDVFKKNIKYCVYMKFDT